MKEVQCRACGRASASRTTISTINVSAPPELLWRAAWRASTGVSFAAVPRVARRVRLAARYYASR